MDNEALLRQFKRTKPGDVGIFGNPVEHSLSPIMQNAALNTWKNVFRDRSVELPEYHKFHVRSEELGEAFDLLKKFKLRGANITIPHKGDACQFVPKLDSFARKTGSINTVVNNDGRLEGFNTDGYGFILSLAADLGFEPEGKTALLLGGGGTGRVIAFQLQAAKAHKIYWWNRHAEKLRFILDEFGQDLPSVEIVDGENELKKISSQVDLVVNATSIGLREGDGLPAESLEIKAGQFVFDVIYNRTTSLMETAKTAGAFVTGGLGMLVHQGAEAFRMWTGQPAPIELMRVALLDTLKKV